MAIDIYVLHMKLERAGLPVVSVREDETIEYSRALTAEEQATADGIIAAHNPDATAALRQWFIDNIQPAVGVDVRNILDLATNQGKINAVVLFALGAIDPETYEIRPLMEWIVPE